MKVRYLATAIILAATAAAFYLGEVIELEASGAVPIFEDIDDPCCGGDQDILPTGKVFFIIKCMDTKSNVVYKIALGGSEVRFLDSGEYKITRRSGFDSVKLRNLKMITWSCLSFLKNVEE